MRQKVALPKFNIPGQSPSWMVRALWALGGLVAIQMTVFVLVVWKQEGAQAAASPSLETSPAIPPKAVAPMQVSALGVPEVPTRAAPSPSETAEAGSVARGGDDTDKAPAPRAAKSSRSSHRAHRGMSRSSKLAKAGGPISKSAGKTKSKKSDALDDLLKRFK